MWLTPIHLSHPRKTIITTDQISIVKVHATELLCVWEFPIVVTCQASLCAPPLTPRLALPGGGIQGLFLPDGLLLRFCGPPRLRLLLLPKPDCFSSPTLLWDTQQFCELFCRSYSLLKFPNNSAKFYILVHFSPNPDSDLHIAQINTHCDQLNKYCLYQFHFLPVYYKTSCLWTGHYSLTKPVCKLHWLSNLPMKTFMKLVHRISNWTVSPLTN